MSITDGQWILDMGIFRQGIRPALNIGLSVTRIGGVGHNKRQKANAAQTLKTLADYRQAEEFSHFGSELALEAKRALETGKRLFELMTQSPTDTFSLMAQQLMMDIVLNLEQDLQLDVGTLKLRAPEAAAKVTGDDNYDAIRAELLAACVKKLEGVEPLEAPKVEEKAPELSEADKKQQEKDAKKVEKQAEKDAKEVSKHEVAAAKIEDQKEEAKV
jgi:F-type H+-transporting ATPase subunit alpha